MLEKDVFSGIDFDALLARQRAESSFGERPAAAWNQRAAKYGAGGSHNDYTRTVLAGLNLEGVRTVLDIGCGPGNLAVPLAQRVEKVTAIDFSEGMLERLRARAAEAGVGNIEARHLAWADEWEGVEAADLALCSRAMDFANLRACLAKMDRMAKKRCCLILHAGKSYLGEDVMRLLETPIRPRADYIYAVAMLYQAGIEASVDFFESDGGMSYGSADEFLESVRWRIGALTAGDEGRLRAWYGTLPAGEDGRVKYSHPFRWARMCWEKRPWA